ncbi:hypothetical protein [Oceanobacillus sp. J11TS1]|uniref:hypothetical protein n=1 Tax=Oceanobacillus sp. J11TS1 TaxID=2807191 RepID=UPI001BB333FC|nr:hypothetical protein [Oceanobacillus sp. J11TS1]
MELVQDFHQAVFIGAAWLINTVAEWVVNTGLVEDQLMAFIIVMTTFVCIFAALVFPSQIIKGQVRGNPNGENIRGPMTILIVIYLIIKIIWDFFRKLKENRLFLLKTIFVISTIAILAMIGYSKM